MPRNFVNLNPCFNNFVFNFYIRSSNIKLILTEHCITWN